MNPCKCGGKGVVRVCGEAAPHIGRKSEMLTKVICSMNVSSYRKCRRQTRLYTDRAMAVSAWDSMNAEGGV